MRQDPRGELALQKDVDFDDLGKTVLGLFDQPAYMRRALAVEEGIAHFQKRLAKQREEGLEEVRRAGQVWRRVYEKRPAQGARAIDRYVDGLGAPERSFPTGLWLPSLPKARAQLVAAVERFNRRWNEWLGAIDLAEVNRLIENYNRHYLLEKECAFRSPWAAARGFVPMKLLDRETLRSWFPPLGDVPVGED